MTAGWHHEHHDRLATRERRYVHSDHVSSKLSANSLCYAVTELVTPPLDGMILPGVTRDSVLSLARDHAAGKHEVEGLPEKLVVVERPITMKEVKDASHDGRLVEFFGTGTFNLRLRFGPYRMQRNMRLTSHYSFA